jgi:hypothetical protein
MKNNFKVEVAVSFVLVALSIFLLNPFSFWMPNMMHVLMLGIILVAFAFFAVFILREKVQDEREASHRQLSGRVAFLTGSALLTVGIIIQSVTDMVDVWLVITLVAMVLSKIVTRIYSDSRL